VAAAVTEAGLVTDMDLAGAECVSVWPARRRVGDPLAVGRLHQIAKHNLSLGRDGSRPGVRTGSRIRTDDLPLSLAGRYFLPMWWTVWWIPFILTAPLMLGLLVEAIWGSRNPGVAWIAVSMGYGLIAAFSGSRRRR